MYRDVLFIFFLLVFGKHKQTTERKNKHKTKYWWLKIFDTGLIIVFVYWTCLRGVSSMASSSSCSLSQSHWAFRFLFLHSHPCLRLVLVPSAASSGPWEGVWNLLPRLPISTLTKQASKIAGQLCCVLTLQQSRRSIWYQNHESCWTQSWTLDFAVSWQRLGRSFVRKKCWFCPNSPKSRYSNYKNIRQKKAANSHISEA